MKNKTLFAVLFLFIVSNSLYLTNLVNRYTIDSIFEYIFVFAYFIVINCIVISIFKYILNKRKHEDYSWRSSFFFSLILSVLIVGAGGEFFDNHKYRSVDIVVSSTGERNEQSKGSEVWINEVTVGGSVMDLSKLQYENWDYKDGSLLNYSNQPSSLTISFPAERDLVISFLQHEWSGVVKIIDGSHESFFDLYSKESGNIQYGVKSNVSPKSFQSNIDYLMATLLVFILLICIIYLGSTNSVWFGLGLAFIYSLVFIYSRDININKYIDLLFILMSISSGIISSNFLKNLIQSRRLNFYFKMLVPIFIVALLVSFAIARDLLFYSTGTLRLSIETISGYFLILLLVLSFEIMFISLFNKIVDVLKPQRT